MSTLNGNGDLHNAVDGPSDRLPLRRSAETQLFGIAREALSNTCKHASARVARVSIETSANGVVMEIADDGCGFAPDTNRAGHFGLDSMRSRAAEIGAELTIASEQELGTVVRVEVPASVDRI